MFFFPTSILMLKFHANFEGKKIGIRSLASCSVNPVWTYSEGLRCRSSCTILILFPKHSGVCGLNPRPPSFSFLPAISLVLWMHWLACNCIVNYTRLTIAEDIWSVSVDHRCSDIYLIYQIYFHIWRKPMCLCFRSDQCTWEEIISSVSLVPCRGNPARVIANKGTYPS